MDNKNYLLDSDTNRLIWLFPWLIWLFAFAAYEIKNTDMLLAEKKSSKKSSEGKLILMASVFTAVMVRLVPAEIFTGKPFPGNELLLSIFMIVLFLYLLFLRNQLSKKNEHKGKIDKAVKIKLNFFKFLKDNIKFILVFALGILISVLLYVETIWLFIIGGNPLSLFLFLIVYIFLLFANQTIKAPEVYEVLIEE
ncbi:DUF443 family protein [Enterococcus sp. BWR-S5]|nr:DUF443 family protein [Enterococcus sp. BWR-S5]